MDIVNMFASIEPELKETIKVMNTKIIDDKALVRVNSQLIPGIKQDNSNICLITQELNKKANTLKKSYSRSALSMLDNMAKGITYSNLDLTPLTKPNTPLSSLYLKINPSHSSETDSKVVTGDVEEHKGGIIFDSAAQTSDESDYAVIVHTRY